MHGFNFQSKIINIPPVAVIDVIPPVTVEEIGVDIQ
jgi:hypothetical protein